MVNRLIITYRDAWAFPIFKRILYPRVQRFRNRLVFGFSLSLKELVFDFFIWRLSLADGGQIDFDKDFIRVVRDNRKRDRMRRIQRR